MDEDPPKRPRAFVLGSDLDRHSVRDLQALESELKAELDRVRRAMAARDDVRSAAEAMFKSSGKPPLPDG